MFLVLGNKVKFRINTLQIPAKEALQLDMKIIMKSI